MADNNVTKNQAFFAELLSPSAAKWSAGVAFDRSNGLPLDQWSVFQTKAKAEEYLTNAKAYPGQVIAYADDNGEMVACVLSQNADGSALVLKQIGIIPTGDNKTVEVSATGEITLKGAAGATAGQQPRIVNKGTAEAPKLELEWYTPDNSTVSGLQETVGALGETVNGVVAEDGSVTKEGLTHKIAALDSEIGEKAAEGKAATGLYKEVNDALTAAKAYADAKEHKNTTYELTQDGMTLTLTSSEGEAGVVTIDAYSTKEVDDKVKDAKDRADEAYNLAETKVDATTYATDKKALEDEDAAVRQIAEGVRDAFNTFMNSEEIDETVNTLKEVQAEIAKMTDATELASALAGKADNSALEAVDKKFENYTTTESMNTLLAGKQDVIPANTYEAYGEAAKAQAAAEKKAGELADAAKTAAIAEAGKLADAAKQAAIDDAAGKYATTGALDAVKKTAEDAVTAEEMAAHVTEAIKDKADASALDGYYTKEEADDKVAAAVTPANDKLKEIEAGAQVNKIEVIKVNGTPQSITDKAVDITVPTDVKDLADANHKYVTTVKMREAEGYTPWVSATQADGVVVISDEAVQTTVNGIKATAEAAVQTAEFAGVAMTKTGTKLSIAQADAQNALGLKSAAYEEASAFAPFDIDTGVHAVDLTTGDNNGEVKLTVDGASKNVKVKGLGSAAYTEADAYEVAGAAAAVLGASTDAAGAATVHGALNKAAEILGTANDGATANTVYGAKAAAKANADAIEELKDELGNLSNIMNFRGVVEHKGDNTLSQDVAEAGIGDLTDGDVIIYGEKEYVYQGGAWHEFGDATGNAAAIEGLTNRVTAIEGWKPENASNTKAGLVKGSEKGVNIEAGEVKSVSMDLLVNGEYEIVFSAGNAFGF